MKLGCVDRLHHAGIHAGSKIGPAMALLGLGDEGHDRHLG
jgi:hypothetical protein